ncbi:phage protein [Enterobacter roggenkampii]|uniref:phage protein n=1 Tax=Enterobacter roggenkampii TaxID=1812935 RepID=UPI003890013B
MTQRIGGMDFDITVGTDVIHVENVSLDITDNTAVAQSRGVPDGYVKGDVAAEGEIELDEKNFAALNEQARTAGSWRDLPPLDMLFYASAGGLSTKVEAFGCKFIITNPLNFDPKGGEKATKKLKYLVTAPEFVRIDDVPILSESDLRNIVG